MARTKVRRMRPRQDTTITDRLVELSDKLMEQSAALSNLVGNLREELQEQKDK